MCISKQNSIFSNIIDIGCVDFPILIETGYIPHPQIIRQNKNYVRAALILLCIAPDKSKKKTAKNKNGTN
jgi:hypothetical protein